MLCSMDSRTVSALVRVSSWMRASICSLNPVTSVSSFPSDSRKEAICRPIHSLPCSYSRWNFSPLEAMSLSQPSIRRWAT